MYAKNVAFPSGFLCNSLLKEKQKNSIVFSHIFCIHYFSKMKRKPVKQKIDTCFPINNLLFVAHIPKIRQI